MAMLKKIPKYAAFAHAGVQQLILWELKVVKEAQKWDLAYHGIITV